MGGCRPPGEPATESTPPPPEVVSADPRKLTIRQAGPARAFLGNGYLGVNASPLGWARDGGQALPGFISGFYQNESLAVAPEWAAPDIRIGGVSLNTRGARDYEQTLDLRRGLLHTRYRWRGKPEVEVEAILFPARHSPYLGVLRIVLKPRRNTRVTLFGATVVPRGCAVSLWDTAAAGDAAPQPWPAYEAELKAGETWTFTRYAGVCAERDLSQAQRERLARNAVAEAKRAGFDGVVQAHTAAWEKLWQRNLAIEGDPHTQQVLNAFRYYLLASVRAGRADSVPPMGISSDIYQGHIFWDADTWIFPA
ncbi:MAG: hypothetical protein QHJ73_19375, partial [Armatimonadota bacterium]|nr:hypothetical protein [Armatimonadota bacterium]